MPRPTVILLALLPLACFSSHAQELPPVLPRETDPDSPRRSQLCQKPDEATLRLDLDSDGDPDLFERWWQGKRIRWIDEIDNATWSDVMPDGLGDALQIDVDGDGYYDGPSDLTLKWWDKDGDGIPDIEIYQENPGPTQTKAFTGSSHFFVSINLDQSSRFSGIDWRKLRTDFASFQNKVNWRPNYHGNSIFIPHGEAMERVFSNKWGKAYLTFDEDDDCHRWERVELYYPGDPYILQHGNPKSVIRHNQADTLGDRGEWDVDFSGGGKLYFAPWSGGIHLLGAERGVWLVDKDRRYWGAAHPNELVSREKATKPEEVVQFEDRDDNGFFDLITHDFDGDGTVDLTIDLVALGIDDRGTVIDPATLGWEGLRDAYAAHVRQWWQHVMRLHRDALRLGFADADDAELTLATATSERRRNAHLIRMAVLRRVLDRTPAEGQPAVLRAWFGPDPLAPSAIMAETAARMADQAALPRFVPHGVVLDYQNLRYKPHNDVIFPSVVATAGRIRNPLGKYYLYYAPHDPPGGICLAYADQLTGPWIEHPKNPLIAKDWLPHHQVSHVSGPHALWNDQENLLFLYYHGENPVTRLATSEDGVHFEAGGVVLATSDFPGLTEASYARVFPHRIDGEDTRFVMLFMGNDRGTRRIYQARSADGRKWRPVPGVFMNPPPGTDQVAGAWWFPWQGRHFLLCHANADRAGAPGGIHNQDFHLYLAETDASFRPARHHGQFMHASAFGPSNPGLMSPCVFEENGMLFLFLNTGARLNNRISLAITEAPASR